MKANYGQGLYREYELLLTENEEIKAKYKMLLKEHDLLQKEIELRKRLEVEVTEKAEEIEALKKEILRLNGYINIDGTNSGIPTSKTPITKKKVIPNSRKKTDKKIGGQAGHPKSKLKAFKDEEITRTQIHESNECPMCGGKEIRTTDESINKDELDYEVVVIKRRHKFPVYECIECGHKFHEPISVGLKEENQYGSNVQALSLSLMNIGNVSVNKVRKMIYGLSEEEINPTEGYIIKQQKKAANALTNFNNDLTNRCLNLSTVYWDDTVIDINKKRGCLRFYGDEKIALYKAHINKSKEGLDEDNILKLLPEQAVVMHDHNKVNYNKEYSFSNIECNVHLLRDLQKTTDNLEHEWSGRLKKLLEKTNTERNEKIEKGESSFDDAYVKTFYEEFDKIMLKAAEENKEDYNKYYGKDELTLILRIFEYKDNYLSWVVNFNLPFSNNLSERALRGAKSKMKVSGQFQNVESARNYAAIKSYIETCYRNGINQVKALVRLCKGNPYSLDEIFASDMSE